MTDNIDRDTARDWDAPENPENGEDGDCLIVTADAAERADAALARLSGLSRSLVQKYIEAGSVTELDNGKSISKKDKTKPGTSGCFGAALVHSVKTFKDSLLMLFGDTDSCI